MDQVICPVNTNKNLEKSTPKWLTAEFFNDILENKFNQLKIISFTVEAALPVGENFTSVLYRVKIEIENKDGTVNLTSYITKSPPENCSPNDLSDFQDMFSKEREIYENVAPKLENLFANFGCQLKFVPRCLKICTKSNVLVFEDLRKLKFENIKRQIGMDARHAKAVLAKLAQIHAGSACLTEIFDKNLLDQNRFIDISMPGSDKWMKSMWPYVFRSMEKMVGCKEYIRKLRKQENRAVMLMAEAMRYDPDEFNVLVHGDLWSNNIMFQYGNSGDITEVYFVDWQVPRWGSPTQDLHFFFVTSLNSTIRTQCYDYFVKYYYDQLVQHLNLLKYQKPLPRLIDIQIQMLKRGYLGLNCALISLPTAIMEPTELATAENMIDETEGADEFKKLMFFSPQFECVIKELVPFFDNRGLLDI